MAILSPVPSGVNFAPSDPTQVHHSTIAGAFSSQDLELLQSAFDLAWQNLAGTVETGERSFAREKLAAIVISSGNPSQVNAEVLARMAIRAFTATSHPELKIQPSYPSQLRATT